MQACTKTMWCELPQEIVATILGKLGWVSFIRAGAVCKSWRAAMMEIKALKVRLPFLRECSIHGSSRRRCRRSDRKSYDSLIDVTDNTIYRLRLHNASCLLYLGSGDGWLIAEAWLTEDGIRRRRSFIFNPFSRNPLSTEGIKLLNPTKPRNLAPGTKREIADSCWLVREIFDRYWVADSNKVTLSSPPTSDDCVVVAIHGLNRLAFYELEAASLLVFQPKPGIYMRLRDVICYNRRAYALTNRFELVVFELHPEPKPLKYTVLPPSEAEIGAIYVHPPSNGREVTYVAEVYLVESCSGELLMVLELWTLRTTGTEEDFCRKEMQGFLIFKLNKSERRWVKVERLSGEMLFLSRISSRAVPIAVGLPGGFKENSICFGYVKSSDIYEFGVFNLEGRSTRALFPSDCLEPHFPFLWPPLI